MLATPVVLDETPIIKRADEFSFSIQFKEDAAHYDLSTFTNVTVVMKDNKGTEIFTRDIKSGNLALSSSAATNNDIISGVVNANTMDTKVGKHYIEVWTERDNDPQTKNSLVSTRVRVSAEGESGTAHEWVITLTESTNTATGERATNVMALAVQYKNEAETAKTAAETARDTATTQAGIATTKANEASASSQTATTKASEASASEDKAEKWAEEAEDVEVETGKYSAKHYSAKSDAVKAAIDQAIADNFVGNDIDIWSYTVGTKPSTSGQLEGAIGAYFTSAGELQKLELQSGAWVDVGEPISTKKYVDDKASLLATLSKINDQTDQEAIDLDDNFVIQKKDGSVRKMNYNNLLSELNLDNWFTMTIKTDNVGTSNNDQFTIPTNGTGYDYTVLWGDGTSDTGLTGNATHTYPSAGTYTVRIKGAFPTIYFNNGGDKNKLIEINSWGDIEWKSFEGSFFGCSNLVRSDSRYINTSQVTNMRLMFYNCSSLTNLDVSGFNTSQVTNMNIMFYNCTSLTTLDVSGFDTSQVTNMGSMFHNCTSLTTLDVSGFDTSQVTNMGSMFRNCSSLTNFNPSGFTITNVTEVSLFSVGTNMGTTVYDSLLVNWEAQLVNNNLSPNFGDAQYTAGSAAATARQALIADHSWTITDGGSI